MQPAELPRLDAVVLSHLHGDHFDRVAKKELDRARPVITTPHAAHRLGGWGFRKSVALQNWETHELERGGDRVRITSLPGTHGPGVVGRLLPPGRRSPSPSAPARRPSKPIRVSRPAWGRAVGTRWVA